MADRIQYNMHHNYNQALIHQQQQVQQQSQQIPSQQQPQPQPQDSHPSVPNARMWQHMQQMRSHPTDPSAAQSGSQLADMFRNQSMVRLPQGQAQSQSHQFPSGIGMPQMAANQGINGPQQSFQDLSTNQPQPSHMPSVNINGISSSNVHMNSGPQPLQSRNTLLQNFNRPYDVVFAQNQHPQSGSIAFNNKQGLPPQPPAQQQTRDHQHMQSSNHAQPTELFSSPNMQADAMRRPSPSHAPMPLQHIQNGAVASTTQHNPSVPQNPMSIFSSRPLPEQVVYLRSAIRAIDNNIGVQKASLSDGDQMTKARVLAALMSKRDAMNKLLNNVLAALQAQNGAGQGQMSWMLQQQQQQPGPSQSSFDAMSMQRAGLGMQASSTLPQSQVQHQPSNPNVNPGSLVQAPQSSQVIAQSSLPLQSSASSLQANHINTAGNTFPAQAPIPSNPSSFNIPSGLSQQLPSQQSQMQRTTAQPTAMHNAILQMIPPLDKPRFDLAFKSFCNSKQVKIDHRVPTVNNRAIDLHALHTLVMREGGENKVQQRDLWSIIGGRMGFVQFPGTDTEPAKSGPVIAQQLEHIYRQYLANFDRAYIANVLDSRIKNNPGNLPSNASQLNLMVSVSEQPTTQLKMQGFTEQMIQFIESHRSHLQRMRLERDGFHNPLKLSINEQGAQMPVNGNGAIPPMNQLSGPRQTSFVQPNPQSNVSHVSGHPAEARQQLMHQMSSNSAPNRPGKEQLQAAMALITKTRQETLTSNENRPPVAIPLEQRNEFNTLIEQIHRQAAEIENKLAMLYIYTRKEDFVRRIIVVSVTVQQQRNILLSSTPRFFVTLENLRMMHQQMQQAIEMCSQLYTALTQQRGSLQQLQPGPRQVNARSPFPPEPAQVRTSAQLQPSPSLQPQQQTSLQQPTLPQMPLHPPPKKKLQASAVPTSQMAVSTPSPAPTSVHTPGPSAPSATTPLNNTPSTPALPSSSSPPVSRSPKGKIPAKVKQTPAPTPKRRPSKTVPPVTHVESPATPSSNASVKRPREDEDNIAEAEGSSSASHTNIPSEPSPPKRVKTEWENSPNEELKKKGEEIVKVESVEDANTFIQRMSELLKNAAGDEGQESTLNVDLSETLGMILKGCTTMPEASDNSLAIGEAITGRESPPASAGFGDAFEEFIDYSFGLQEGQLDDEEGSKAHTPELLPSSTNLSPESNTDGETSLLATSMTSIPDLKKEDHHDLRLGLWREFDGGESAYYQPYELWKWDSPMPVLEQSWAVSTS